MQDFGCSSLANEIVIRNNIVELNNLLARNFIELAKQSIADHDGFHVALSGGNTPQAFYQLLGAEPYLAQVAWDKVHIYQTDERFVPSEHVDNNFFIIQRCLLNAISLPEKNQHRIQTEYCSPTESSEIYDTELTKYLPRRNGHYQFDYMLLGVGTDGHIASLFPGDMLGIKSQKMVISTYVKHLQSWRISLTLSAINHARNIVGIVVGEQKSSIVESVVNPPQQPMYPVHYLGAGGAIVWYLDKAAACSLKHSTSV